MNYIDYIYEVREHYLNIRQALANFSKEFQENYLDVLYQGLLRTNIWVERDYLEGALMHNPLVISIVTKEEDEANPRPWVGKAERSYNNVCVEHYVALRAWLAPSKIVGIQAMEHYFTANQLAGERECQTIHWHYPDLGVIVKTTKKARDILDKDAYALIHNFLFSPEFIEKYSQQYRRYTSSWDIPEIPFNRDSIDVIKRVLINPTNVESSPRAYQSIYKALSKNFYLSEAEDPSIYKTNVNQFLKLRELSRQIDAYEGLARSLEYVLINIESDYLKTLPKEDIPELCKEEINLGLTEIKISTIGQLEQEFAGESYEEEKAIYLSARYSLDILNDCIKYMPKYLTLSPDTHNCLSPAERDVDYELYDIYDYIEYTDPKTNRSFYIGYCAALRYQLENCLDLTYSEATALMKEYTTFIADMTLLDLETYGYDKEILFNFQNPDEGYTYISQFARSANTSEDFFEADCLDEVWSKTEIQASPEAYQKHLQQVERNI